MGDTANPLTNLKHWAGGGAARTATVGSTVASTSHLVDEGPVGWGGLRCGGDAGGELHWRQPGRMRMRMGCRRKPGPVDWVEIFTDISVILNAVNPFKSLPLYSTQDIEW